MIRQRQHESIPMRMRRAFVPRPILKAGNLHSFVIDGNPHLLPPRKLREADHRNQSNSKSFHSPCN